MKFKDKIKRSIKKDLDKYRESPEWLNKGIDFDHSLQLIEKEKYKLNNLLKLCNISIRKENLINIEILISNLLYHAEKRPVVISLSPNEWKKSRYVKAGEGTINLVNRLNELGYINLKKGYRFKYDSKKTRIWPTKKLLEFFPDNNKSVIFKPLELVELRDKDGNLKEYKDTARSRNTRSILEQVNKINSLSVIKYRRRILPTSLVAIFIRKFTLYGRLHTKGFNHYQGLSSDDRKALTIDGNEVVELDYSGLHPNLLYASEGIQFNEDPYSIIDDREEVRPYLKFILLCMINGDEINAERAANNWLYENHKQREILNEIGIKNARPLMNKIINIHKKISHHLCSGNDKGLRVMNQDSKIALDVIFHFAQKEIPILTVHDSFIVENKYKEELFRVMSDVYTKQTKGFKCNIK